MSNLWRKISTNDQIILKDHLDEIPVKLGKLAQALGVEVKIATLPPGVSGQIQKVENEDGSFFYRIRINRHEKRERQRFTLAHEISHYLLHRDRIGDGLTDDVLYRSKLSNSLEFEANRLAAEITMPAREINKALEDTPDRDDESVKILSEKFQVSEAAMRIRIGV